MYVCLCNAIKDRDFAAAVNSNASSVSDVFRRCGGAAQCGKCVPDVVRMMKGQGAQKTCKASAG
ncbi:bacterioferritin-associated ferredoxin [Parvularcula sp. LCG005]|uniref:(2Fe-2S)-binding protein n=1 Tax=Parvularcula sp. LCG005 TaxID=3078805 RepID=UPI0029429117|nr:(2Fe-2S)-binding protein [Parvularcula sp. LCG005]WOI53759.1 (2Fe-2S)-binding protein [Parvularcula sp. LCG005]